MVWYLIHHPVRHKVKKKLRVVFDCSRKFKDISLNDTLLQGPDLLNNLVGVLLRLREYPIAFVADIEQMFLQIKVPQSHSDFMRILWWKHGDLEHKPGHYRLTCHTFGAISSPSIANFAVKMAADLAEGDSDAAKRTLANGAYMDDVLCSSKSVKKAYDTHVAMDKAAGAVGFNLRGIMSNSRELLSMLPTDILSSQCKDLDISNDSLPQDRVLGVVWKADTDSFSFKLNIPELGPFTSKRMLLSALSSLYDPLGFVLPVVVEARSLFQRVCSLCDSWDSPIPSAEETVWRRWISDVPLLDHVRYHGV